VARPVTTQEDHGMRADLPAGTVTFLFTDIEGSTRLLHEVGEAAYATALTDHRAALRSAFHRHGGVEVDTQGDAFFYAFPTAPAAVAAAVDGQQALATGRIRVRMGLHTGAPTVTDEGYVGTDVHRAARIGAVAHGGQVVMSAATATLVQRDDLVDLGPHRLKDLSAPERIHQVGRDGFPPLRSLYRTNLPVPSTPFLGREQEIDAVLALLSDPSVRLLTLTGPGGTGKTRLALHAAAQASDAYPDGVFWVPLAELTSPELLVTAVGATLGADGDDIAAAAAGKRLLLMLDNFEHVLDAADRIPGWLAGCPGLDVMVTSREVLRISGEQQYAVPPLSTVDGPRLFLSRARSVDPAFPSDPVVPEICARVDNLPLAIELAAARVNVLTPAQLLERLDARLPVLATTTRDAPSRHRTLRATIEWSHDLLSETERQLFRRLAIFTGGCTLDAAERVAGADLGTIGALADKSLVRHNQGRFWMLATLREFGTEQLERADETDDLSRAHAVYFAGVAESANLTADTTGNGPQHRVALDEIGNLRSAMDWATAVGDIELALSIAVSLEQYWVLSSPYEGVARVSGLLDKETPLPTLLRARALRVLSGSIYIVGRFEEGAALFEEIQRLFEEAGDEVAASHMLMRRAMDSVRIGDLPLARRLLAANEGANLPQSEIAQRIAVHADIARAEGDVDMAIELFLRSAEVAGEAGFAWWEVRMLLNYVETALDHGDSGNVAGPLRRCVELAAEIGDRMALGFGVSFLAWLASRGADDENAGRWWGAVEVESQRMPFGQWEDVRDELAKNLVRDSADFAAGRAAGRLLPFDEAVQEALRISGEWA
jgi:predicted ATPase/class 3 adenylate cyclase